MATDPLPHPGAPEIPTTVHRWAERWATLEPHLDLLLTLTPEARAHWLERHALEHPDSAAQLRALLASRDDASRASFLSGSAAPPWMPEPVHAGDRIGAYELVEPIGEGGMGSVWRARRGDGRFEGTVAIKLLNQGRFDTAAQERFRREGAILANLRHPGIAQLFDAGVTDAGQPYIVLELVDGEAIDRWCDETNTPLRRRLELFLQVLDAVAEAHTQLVIHRDLKPSNIMVNREGRVKLLDFGIARLLNEPAQDGLTRDGALALTPAYAAPEQFDGGPLSLATDVYALGVVLYELLTGTHPSGLDASAPPIAYLRAASEGRTPRTSDRALQPFAGAPSRGDPKQRAARRGESAHALQRQLRGDLDNILARATAPDAARRYRSVPEFADDIRRHLNHEPVHANEAGWTYRAAKFVRRNALAVALASVSALLLSGGVGATWWQAQRAEQARVRAAAERDRAERMLARSDAANGFVGTLLTQVAQSDHPMSFNEIVERGEKIALQQAGGEANRAYVLLTLTGFYETAGNNDKARQLAEQAVALAQQTGDRPLTAVARCVLGNTVAGTGDGPAGEKLVAQGIALAGDDADALMTCWQQRGYIAKGQDDGGAMLEAAQRGMEAAGRLRQPSAVTTALLHDNFAEAYRVLGRYTEADASYAKAIGTLREAGALDTIEGSTIYNNWGIEANECGQLRQALERYQQAIRIQTAILGAESIPPFALVNASRLMAEVGRLDEAWTLAEQGLERSTRSGGAPFVFYAHIAQSTVRRLQGRLEEAGVYLGQAREALATLKPLPERIQQRLALTLAQLEREQGQPGAALKRLDALRETLVRPGTSDAARKPSPVEQAVLKERADTLAALGRHDAALAEAQAALALARALQRDAPTSAAAGSALLTLAKLQLAAGDSAGGRDSAREAARQLADAAGPAHRDAVAARALAGL